MNKCDSCAHGRTCGFRDDWTEECYNYGKEVNNLDKEAMGRRLRELRCSRTQDEVADALGISRVVLSRYENGLTVPGGEILAKLAAYYNVTADRILVGEN